ncbi:hypothetical protein AQF98_11300 [Pedobacter sp. Hv1]|nr:hypothetical protein AQF98_11300 [Pedobacter sp. Hv1]
MKNLFRFSLLAITFILILSSCQFFGNSPKAGVVDSNKVDSLKLDTLKQDTSVANKAIVKPDSITQKH